MTWRKHFTPIENDYTASQPGMNQLSKAGPAKTNYSSYLPDVYSGSPNRIERYQQYEVMDSDPEINAALDILAEFCSQKLKDGKSPFTVKWNSKATNSEKPRAGSIPVALSLSASDIKTVPVFGSGPKAAIWLLA